MKTSWGIDILDGKRADYGNQIVSTVSTQFGTELPDKKLLKRELRLSLEHAREYPGEV
jgi:hypothetical protein